MKTQKDIDEIWIRSDAHEKRLQAREEELEKLIKEYRTKALNIHPVSVSDADIEQVAYDEAAGMDWNSLAYMKCWIEGFDNGAKWHRDK